MDTLKVGDVVFLITGQGPPMAIVDVGEDNVDVVWFDDFDTLQESNLPLACVEIAVLNDDKDATDEE